MPFVHQGLVDAANSPQLILNHRLFCLPSEGIKVGQVITILLKWMEDHPATLHEKPMMVMLESVIDAFPCPKRRAGGGVGPGQGGVIGGEVFQVGGGVSAPAVASKVDPQYSRQARNANLEGTVVLNLVLQRDGTVRDVKVIQPLGMGLDENAIEAVKQWKFRPGVKDGAPVNVAATVEVTFRIMSSPPPVTINPDYVAPIPMQGGLATPPPVRPRQERFARTPRMRCLASHFRNGEFDSSHSLARTSTAFPGSCPAAARRVDHVRE